MVARTASTSQAERVNAVVAVVAVPSIEQSKGWDKLSDSERGIIRKETDAVRNGIKLEAHSRLEIGLHLAKIQEILLPKRLFIAFVDHNFGWSRATAYRYLDDAKTGQKLVAEKILPEPVFEMAIARGMKINEDAIRKNPPPETMSQEETIQYLDTIEKPNPVAASVVYDYDTLMKEALNYVLVREQRVPGNQRTKNNWHNDFIGMLLTKWGIASPMQFKPIAVPESMTVAKGRPVAKAA
jgi:hypothetical protein